MILCWCSWCSCSVFQLCPYRQSLRPSRMGTSVWGRTLWLQMTQPSQTSLLKQNPAPKQRPPPRQMPPPRQKWGHPPRAAALSPRKVEFWMFLLFPIYHKHKRQPLLACKVQNGNMEINHTGLTLNDLGSETSSPNYDRMTSIRYPTFTLICWTNNPPLSFGQQSINDVSHCCWEIRPHSVTVPVHPEGAGWCSGRGSVQASPDLTSNCENHFFIPLN